MSCRQSCQSRHPCTKGNIRAVCEESHFYSLPPATVHAVATTNSKNVETLPRKTTFLASNRSWSQERFVKYNTDLPPPSHSKLFLQVLSMVLYCYNQLQKYLRHCTVFWHKWPVHDLVLVIPPPPLIKVVSNTRPYSKLGGYRGEKEGLAALFATIVSLTTKKRKIMLLLCIRASQSLITTPTL